MRIKRLSTIIVLLGLTGLGAFASVEDGADDGLSGSSGIIIGRYLTASTQHPGAANRSMEVDIEATVPKWKEHGRLRALRQISRMGKITYRVLGFQGDTTVKKEVIGRYLQAEQQGASDAGLSISPANYKFKFKGKTLTSVGEEAYVFQLSPRRKKVGLFKGELWLDARSYMPVLEKGRLVRNPSVFFRKVDFERDFAIQNGASIPSHMSSTINTRLIGKVELNIIYLPSTDDSPGEAGPGDSEAVVSTSSFLP